jgi:hypothetical protein
VFRQKADLQIEVSPFVGQRCQTILRDEYEGRKKDRLDGGDHRQNHKRRVEFRKGRVLEIHHDPGTEPEQMEVDEFHAPGEAGDCIGNAFLGPPLRFVSFFLLEQGRNIPL